MWIVKKKLSKPEVLEYVIHTIIFILSGTRSFCDAIVLTSSMSCDNCHILFFFRLGNCHVWFSLSTTTFTLVWASRKDLKHLLITWSVWRLVTSMSHYRSLKMFLLYLTRHHVLNPLNAEGIFFCYQGRTLEKEPWKESWF